MPDTVPAGSLYLLDAHGLIFQMFFGVKGGMSAPNGRPTNAVFGVTRALMNLYDRGADYLIAALDHKDPTFREKIDPNYKAHRDPPPDDLLMQEPLIQQVMEAMGIPFLIVPGYEADDIMATVAKAAAERGLDVFLCTADKDCRQLIAEKVKILNLRKPEGELLDAAGVLADWGVRPDQVIDFQALVGDAVDNIPGVSGVGPKTASKWLQTHGTLDNIIANADKVPGGPKIKAALQEAIANGNLAMSKALVTLNQSVPLKFDWEGWRRRDWDASRLLQLFQEFGFRGFAERVRSTLASSGAKKNSTVLETAGLSPASMPEKAAALLSTGIIRESIAPRQGTIDLLSFIGESNDSPRETGESKPVLDNWNYSGYELIDTPSRFQSFLTELKSQTRFVFDLETTGLDPLTAEVVGLAFCWKPGIAFYLPVRAPANEATLDPKTTLEALKPIFESPIASKVNQNIKYDLMVLAAHGISLANVAGDPMVAHYLLEPGARSHGLDDLTRDYLQHTNIKISELIGKGKKQIAMDMVSTAKVRDYSCEDADTAFQLAARFEPLLEPAGLRKLYDSLEIPLIGVLADMERNGIRINELYLKKLSAEMGQELETLEKEIYDLAGHKFNIASLKQLQTVLFDELKLPVQKRTGIKSEPSTDQESLERLAALGHQLPKKLVAYRQVTKLKGTYVDILPTLVNQRTGRIHTSFNQTTAETGRLSSSDPNLQNIPTRTEQGAQLRKAFIPQDGWKLVTADYSQVELRLLAHFCGDETLRAAFAEDRDVHAAVAAEIFKVPVEQVSKQQRGLAKTVNFGVLYGMSASGLATRLSIPKTEADQFIDAYFRRYPKVLEYQNSLLANCRKRGYVATILGRKRHFDPAAIRPHSTYHARNQAEREAINMEIQGSAADLLKQAMLNVDGRLKREKLAAKMLLTVHDELVFESPPDEVATVATIAREEMTRAMNLDVQLKVDVAAGANWLDVEDV